MKFSHMKVFSEATSVIKVIKAIRRSATTHHLFTAKALKACGEATPTTTQRVITEGFKPSSQTVSEPSEFMCL